MQVSKSRTNKYKPILKSYFTQVFSFLVLTFNHHEHTTAFKTKIYVIHLPPFTLRCDPRKGLNNCRYFTEWSREC